MPTMKMRSPLLTAVLSFAALTPFSPVSAGGAGAPAAKTATADAQTIRVVKAADAFLNTLSATQKKAVLFAWSDTAQRKNWSNFPLGGPGANRKGLRWGELSAAQRTALMTLLAAVLSQSGVDMVKGQMLADDLIRATDQGQGPAGAGGPPASSSGGGSSAAGQTAPTTPPAGSPAGGLPAGSRPQVSFGSEYYFVSFVGTPSTTSPWLLQFGGHHLAINATVVGSDITLSPSLTGGEPIRVSFNGKTYTLVPNVPVEAQAAFALLQSLTPAQRAKAVVSTTRTDLVLGPGQDGKTLQPEGLPGSAMTSAQKTQFLALIKDRLGILNADDLAAKMSVIQKNLDQTYFAWFGPTTSAGAAYHRVTGPSVIIEFSPQANDGDPTNHLHNMYRDPTNDYGAAWTTLK